MVCSVLNIVDYQAMRFIVVIFYQPTEAQSPQIFSGG